MQFIKTEDLKMGMRLARPIYNKKGVLLFERNSKLSAAAIESVRNFGLLGIYVLEPAEPLPPMSEEDLEFERFQTRAIFSIQDEIENILIKKKQNKLQVLANMIIKNFGRLDNKFNFYQNLRSRDDYVYRHSLNVAILCSIIAHAMKLRSGEQLQTVLAAMVHDIGKIQLGGDFVYREDFNTVEEEVVYNAHMDAAIVIESSFSGIGSAVRRICVQAARKHRDGEKIPNAKMLMGARILMVANRYDELTAMSLKGEPKSEVKAIQELMEHPEFYDPQVVDALIQSVNILFPGVSLELNTGEKALVLVENMQNILRPVVFSFRDNSIFDLSLPVNDDIKIVDIMKTLDNRYIMDIETLKAAGYNTKEE